MSNYMALWDINRRRHSTPVLLPGKSHGWRSLVGCSPWGHEKSDTYEWLHFHFSLSWTGEGNGNPLQCSCLKNPRDGGAWWAAVYGIVQSQTRLKRLSSSSSLSPPAFMVQNRFLSAASERNSLCCSLHWPFSFASPYFLEPRLHSAPKFGSTYYFFLI